MTWREFSKYTNLCFTSDWMMTINRDQGKEKAFQPQCLLEYLRTLAAFTMESVVTATTYAE